MAKLSAEYTFMTPLNITLPRMNIYQKRGDDQISQAIDILEKPNIDLARAIFDTLTDASSFQNQK